MVLIILGQKIPIGAHPALMEVTLLVSRRGNELFHLRLLKFQKISIEPIFTPLDNVLIQIGKKSQTALNIVGVIEATVAPLLLSGAM